MTTQPASAFEDHPVARRIRRPGPKNLLALDGGGTRGIVTLAFLKRIETLLAERYGTGTTFRLRDHYDMIGGTSTGSIIATALALGQSVDQIVAAYNTFASQLMKRRAWRKGIFGTRFSGKAIDENLRLQYGETTLGSPDITCALVIVTKRLDTGSVWMLHNNPLGHYYGRPLDHTTTANKDIPLHRLVRASSAAPTFFDPEAIDVMQGSAGIFIDGAVSPFANPSLLLFLVATTPAYHYNWPAGELCLNLTSIGTGLRRPSLTVRRLRWLPSVLMAALALKSVIEDCSRFSHMILQTMAAVRTPWVIDREAGVLDHFKPAERRLLSYARFQLPLDGPWLKAEIGRQLPEPDLDRLAQMDNPAGMDALFALSTLAAERFVRPELLFPEAAPPAAPTDR